MPSEKDIIQLRSEIAELNEKINDSALDARAVIQWGVALVIFVLTKIIFYFSTAPETSSKEEKPPYHLFLFPALYFIFMSPGFYVAYKNNLQLKRNLEIKPFLSQKDFEAHIDNSALSTNDLFALLEDKKHELTTINEDILVNKNLIQFTLTSLKYILPIVLLNNILHITGLHSYASKHIAPFFVVFSPYNMISLPISWRALNQQEKAFFKALEENSQTYIKDGKIGSATEINNEVAKVASAYQQHIAANRIGLLTIVNSFVSIRDIAGLLLLNTYIETDKKNRTFLDKPYPFFRLFPNNDHIKKATLFAQFAIEKYLQSMQHLFSFTKKESQYADRLQYFISFRAATENKKILISASKLASIFYNLLLKHIPQTYAFENIPKGQLLIVFKELNIKSKDIHAFKTEFTAMVTAYQQQKKITIKLNEFMAYLFKEEKLIQNAFWFFNDEDKDGNYYFSLQFSKKTAHDLRKIITTNFYQVINRLNHLKLATQSTVTIDDFSDEVNNDPQISYHYLKLKVNKNLLDKLAGKPLQDYLKAPVANAAPNSFVDIDGTPIPHNPAFIPVKNKEKAEEEYAAPVGLTLPEKVITFTLNDGTKVTYSAQQNAVISLGEHKYAILRDKHQTLSPEQFNKAFSAMSHGFVRDFEKKEQGIIRDDGFYKIKILGYYGDDRIPASQLVRSDNTHDDSNRRALLIVFDDNDWMNHEQLDRLRPNLPLKPEDRANIPKKN